MGDTHRALGQPVLHMLQPAQQRVLCSSNKLLRAQYLGSKSRLSVNLQEEFDHRYNPSLEEWLTVDLKAELAQLINKLPALQHLQVAAKTQAGLLDLLQQVSCSPPHELFASFLWLREGSDGTWKVVVTLLKVRSCCHRLPQQLSSVMRTPWPATALSLFCMCTHVLRLPSQRSCGRAYRCRGMARQDSLA